MRTNMLGGLTANLGNCGLAAGTTNTLTTTAATNAVIAGKFATPIAPLTNGGWSTADLNTGVLSKTLTGNQSSVYVFGQAAAGGQLRVVQGSIEKTLPGVTTTPGGFDVAPQFPNLPDDFVPLAYAVVRTAPSVSTWTLGQGLWGTAGVSITFTNVATLPTRPQVA